MCVQPCWPPNAALSHWVLHCLHTVSSCSPSGDTTSLGKQTICSHYKMNIMVYNPGGGGFGSYPLPKKVWQQSSTPQSNIPQRTRSRLSQWFTRWWPLNTSTRIRPLHSCSLSQISRWRAKRSSLEQASWPNTLQRHFCCCWEVEDQLVNFVNKWRGKGIPVSHLSLVR